MKQIFLHIGTQKTGSSSLQFFLQENRKQLAELGYLYPSTERAHHYLAYSLLGDPREQYQSFTWEDTLGEIDNSSLDKIIISSEFFVQSTSNEFIQKIADKLQKYQTKIIIYLKRQDKKIESSFNQQMKTGVYTGTVEFYLQKHNLSSYLKTLDNWAQIFGQENIIVRPLEKQQIPDIYQDFLHCVGITDLEGFQRTEDRNVKPNINQIIAINFINQYTAKRLGLDKQGFHNLNNHPQNFWPRNYQLSFLRYTRGWKGDGNYNLIPYENAVNFLQKYESDNAQIAKKYLNREDGRLFYEPLKEYEHHSLDIQNLSKKQLADLCSFVIKKLSQAKIKKTDRGSTKNKEYSDDLSLDDFLSMKM
jgi:hypothetical protein